MNMMPSYSILFIFIFGQLINSTFGELHHQQSWSKWAKLAPQTPSLPSPSPSTLIDGPASPTINENDPIYLESMEDLEHIAYLSLRNFNLTDENLEQSNPSYKRQEDSTDVRNMDDGGRQRLALMLESFIYHLRKDHLRRLDLDELEALARSMNLMVGDQPESRPTTSISPSFAIDGQDDLANDGTNNQSSKKGISSLTLNIDQNYSTSTSSIASHSTTDQKQALDGSSNPPTKTHDRCHYLVQMYRFELESRERINAQNSPNFIGVPMMSTIITDNNSVRMGNISTTNQLASSINQNNNPRIPDVKRLLKLCRLVVDCQSAEDFLHIITGPWVDSASSTTSMSNNDAAPINEPLKLATLSARTYATNQNKQTYRTHRWSRNKEKILVGRSASQLTSSFSDREVESNSEQENPSLIGSNPYLNGQREAKSLRESLSRSVAKLCPLILFQLHDSEGHCTANRDDQPPLIAVWAFATLFVTIVSFCSLIGLSITPLLGKSVTTGEDSSGGLNSSGFSDSSSSSSNTSSGRAQDSQHARNQLLADQKQQNRSCLTLFEGLAVGSLVGSALFSLIPQAFELQDRESNQGFLMKAVIIFFGIYLFFCSERIMRIILDTRQHRKKLKRANIRHSTSVPMGHIEYEPYNNGNQLQMVQFSNQSASRGGSVGHNRSCNRDRLNWRNSHNSQNNINTSTSSKHLINDPDTRTSSRNCNRHDNQNIDQSTSSRTVKKSTASQHNHNQRRKQPHHNQLNNNSQSNQPVKRRRFRKRRTRVSGGKLIKTTRLHQIEVNNVKTDSDSTMFSDGGEGKMQLWSDYKTSEMNQFEDRYDDLSSLDETSISQSLTTRVQHNQRLDDDHDLDARRVLKDSSTKLQPILTGAYNHQHNYHHHYIRHPRSSPLRATFYPSEWAQEKESGQVACMVNPNYYENDIYHQDISTVAWMIVLGDGLHNFIDGISIGAAFSESILSGVSISVAVICEEFPHELGDFAVLVSSGMTVRQALGYNFLSACTCYLGMAFGIILGDVDEGASYISALAAGVFLYIAMVDMMGELSATLEKSSRDSIGKTLNLLLLQNVGIFIGISIIFVLSFIDF